MFKRKQPIWTPPAKPVVYPKWTFCKVQDDYWLVLEKTKMRFISKRAFNSWGRKPVIASEQSLAGYTNWKPIGFAMGSMIKSLSGDTYYITGKDVLAGERRRIETPDVFSVLGFDSRDAIMVSNEEILFHKEGVPVSNV